MDERERNGEAGRAHDDDGAADAAGAGEAAAGAVGTDAMGADAAGAEAIEADAADAAVDGPGVGGGYEEVADAAGGDPADFDPTSVGDGGEVF